MLLLKATKKTLCHYLCCPAEQTRLFGLSVMLLKEKLRTSLSPPGPAAFRGTTWDCESRSLSGNHREVHLPTQVQEGKTCSERFILSHNFPTCWTYVCMSAAVRSGTECAVVFCCSDVLENTVVSFTRDCSREDNVWGGGKESLEVFKCT